MSTERATGISSDELSLHAEDNAIQHRRIGQLVRELAAAASENRPARSFMRVFTDLIGYLEIHFSDQEEFLKLGGYPQDLLNYHRSQHGELLTRLRAMHEYDSDLASVGSNLADWIGTWVEDHMLTEDMGYLEYLRKDLAHLRT